MDEKTYKGSLIDLQQRIEALERIIGDKVFYKQDIGTIIDSLEQKLNAIENLYMNVEDWKKQGKEIAELKEKVEGIYCSIHGIESGGEVISPEGLSDRHEKIESAYSRHLNHTESQDNEINELKEQLQNVANNSGNFEDMLLSKIINLESVLKKFMIMQEKMQNAMSPCSYDEEWYFHPLHKLIDELSGEKESSALSTILEEKESNEWDSATNSKPPEPEIYTSGIQIRIDMEKNELIGEFQSDFDYVWFIMETEGIFDSVTPGDYKKLHVIKKKWEGKG